MKNSKNIIDSGLHPGIDMDYNEYYVEMPIVQDSLLALAKLPTRITVMGGMPVQMYVNEYAKTPEINIPTNDVDCFVGLGEYIGKAELLQGVRDLEDIINEKGYLTSTGKNREGAEMVLRENEEYTPLFVHLANGSENKCKKWLPLRELETKNAMSFKIMENLELKVQRQEDILRYKLKRILSPYHDTFVEPHEVKWAKRILKSETQKELIDNALSGFNPEIQVEGYILKRRDVFKNIQRGNVKDIAGAVMELKVPKDFYHISLIAFTVDNSSLEFDMDYFGKSKKVHENIIKNHYSGSY